MVPNCRLHVAPWSIEYKDMLDTCILQIVTSLTTLTLVQAKQPIFCSPLKETQSEDTIPHKCQGLIVDKSPSIVNELVDVHFYINVGQHTLEACKKILEDRKDLMKEQK